MGPTIEEMRAMIASLTGRPTVSRNPSWLRVRLSDLLAGRGAAASPGAVKPRTVSVSDCGWSAATRMADAEGVSVSLLVRKALRTYAQKHHPDESENLE